MPNLFRLADLAGFTELPGDIREARLEPHFTDVEMFRFRPLLAQAWPTLFDALAGRRAVLDAYAVALAAYSAQLGQVPAPALAPVAPVAPVASVLDDVLAASRGLVANATLARFWPFAQTALTKKGLVQKNLEQSEPVSTSTINRQVAVFQQSANSYEAMLEKVLHDKADAIRLELAVPAPPSGRCDEPRRRTGSPVTHLTIRKQPRDRFDGPVY